MLKYFDNIIGNENLKTMLTGYIKTSNMPHAFIIEGPCGSGRKHIAKSIAAAISCKNHNSTSIPCLSCINCEKIFKGVCPDVILIDTNDKTSIGVDVIREICEHTYVTPNELEHKIYIIDEADKLTTQAQNAFLKTLEEPVTQVMYFLICENSQILLPTIISRAPVIRTAPLSRNEILSYLKKEHFTSEDLLEIVSISENKIGKATELLNNEDSLKEKRRQRKEIFDFLDLFTTKIKKTDIITYFCSYSEKNEEHIERLRLLYSAFRDIILYKELKTEEFDFFINSQEIGKYTNHIKPRFAKKMSALIENTIQELYLNLGNSSLNSIMLKLATEAYNAKQ